MALTRRRKSALLCSKAGCATLILFGRWPLASRGQSAGCLDEAHDGLQTVTLAEIGHDKRPCATHLFGVSFHLFQRGSDIRGEIDLVDDQKIGTGDARSALGR